MSFEQGKLYRYLNSDGWNRTIFSTNKLNVTDVIDLRNKTIGEVERDSIILILEALEPHWYKIIYKNILGYCIFLPDQLHGI